MELSSAIAAIPIFPHTRPVPRLSNRLTGNVTPAWLDRSDLRMDSAECGGLSDGLTLAVRPGATCQWRTSDHEFGLQGVM
jgi:hypothetical protein